jgi:molybdopterin-binding protein
MKYGVRNSFKGTVREIKKGTVMCEVVVEINSTTAITSVMTLDSLNDLNLKIGDKVVALTKAINVVLLKEE